MAEVIQFSKRGFMRLPQVLKLIPVAKSTWWAGVKDGRFPAGVKLGKNTTAWRVEDIEVLIQLLGGYSAANDNRTVAAEPRQESGHDGKR